MFVSGQLPMVDGAMPQIGKVGTDVTVEQAVELARISALNALAVAANVAGSLDRIVRIVQVTGHVACDPSFIAHPKVVDGASEFFGHVLGEAGGHARIAMGASSLPLDAPVEIAILAEVE